MTNNMSYGRNVPISDLVGDNVVVMHYEGTIAAFDTVDVSGMASYDRAHCFPKRDKNHVILCSTLPHPRFDAFLERNGFGTQNQILVPGNPKVSLQVRVRQHAQTLIPQIKDAMGHGFNDAKVSVYYGSDTDKKACDALGLPMYASPQASDIADNKAKFHLTCKALGVPVVEGERIVRVNAQDPLGSIEKMIQHVYECIDQSPVEKVMVRGARGASGSTNYVIKWQQGVRSNEKVYNQVGDIVWQHVDRVEQVGADPIKDSSIVDHRFLVAPFVEYEHSPASNWFVGLDGAISQICTNVQILSGGTVHEGNHTFLDATKEAAIDENAIKLVKAYKENGYLGPLGFDLLDSAFIECNARMSGNSYPFGMIVNTLAQRHGYPRFAVSQNLYSRRKGINFGDIENDIADILYDASKGTSEGVFFPYNVGPLEDGKMSVVVTGENPEHTEKIFARLARLGFFRDPKKTHSFLKRFFG